MFLADVRRQSDFRNDLGAVAQLGERLICIQEVAGSIPTSSTRLGKKLGNQLGTPHPRGPVAQVARAHP
jgi:hypothetical protein